MKYTYEIYEFKAFHFKFQFKLYIYIYIIEFSLLTFLFFIILK
jgi:hypothetical protein